MAVYRRLKLSKLPFRTQAKSSRWSSETSTHHLMHMALSLWSTETVCRVDHSPAYHLLKPPKWGLTWSFHGFHFCFCAGMRFSATACSRIKWTYTTPWMVCEIPYSHPIHPCMCASNAGKHARDAVSTKSLGITLQRVVLGRTTFSRLHGSRHGSHQMRRMLFILFVPAYSTIIQCILSIFTTAVCRKTFQLQWKWTVRHLQGWAHLRKRDTAHGRHLHTNFCSLCREQDKMISNARNHVCMPHKVCPVVLRWTRQHVLNLLSKTWNFFFLLFAASALYP